MPVYALARFGASGAAGGWGRRADQIPTSSSLIAHASSLAKVVLLILLIFSAVSWGIILYKFWHVPARRAPDGTFLGVFRKSSKFSEVQAVCPGVAGRARWSVCFSPGMRS